MKNIFKLWGYVTDGGSCPEFRPGTTASDKSYWALRKSLGCFDSFYIRFFQNETIWEGWNVNPRDGAPDGREHGILDPDGETLSIVVKEFENELYEKAVAKATRDAAESYVQQVVLGDEDATD